MLGKRDRQKRTSRLNSQSKGTAKLKNATSEDLKAQRGGWERILIVAEPQGRSYCNILHSEGEGGKAGFPGNCVFGAKITRELGTALLS